MTVNIPAVKAAMVVCPSNCSTIKEIGSSQIALLNNLPQIEIFRCKTQTKDKTVTRTRSQNVISKVIACNILKEYSCNM